MIQSTPESVDRLEYFSLSKNCIWALGILIEEGKAEILNRED